MAGVLYAAGSKEDATATMTALAKQVSPTTGSGVWTAVQFLDFYMSRPDEERWQLVDGLAIMMVPPNKSHQRIVGNLVRLLNGTLAVRQPSLLAYENLGIRIPGVANFHPQPDIVVCAAEADDSYYQESYALLAEVISPSNTAELIARKIELYQSHPDNLYCMTIDQDSVHVTLYAREKGWARTDLPSLDDVLRLPAFSFETKVADIYKGTPLAG
jgi:Uma2 family endonuclease